MSNSSLISRIFETQLIPWLATGEAPPLIVARPRLKQMKLENDLPLISRKLQGPRKMVRASRFGELIAQWPNDKLLESHAPLLLFVLSGEAELHCGNYLLRAPQGRAVFIPGGVPRWTGTRTLEHRGDNPERFCSNILFRERCGSLEVWVNYDRGNEHFRSPYNETLVVHNVRLIRLLEEIQEEVSAQRAHYQAISRRLLEAFLFTLQRDLQEDKAIHPGRLAVERMPLDHQAPIQRAQQYVRDHLHEPLTQDRVARLVGMSRTQFIRRFREETGQTFNQFVTVCRLEQAGVLLQGTDLPLGFIAPVLGYKSPVYFNTVFRKHKGMLPSEFRALKKDL